MIAVDNGSTDGSYDLLVRALGENRVLVRPDNPGLPAAVQAALAVEAARSADYVLIHHDDVALDPDAIRRMVEVAERIEGVGVVGPKVVDWDDARVLREVGLSTDRFGYPYSPLEQDELDQGQYDRVREVLFVSSSAMLISRAALERAGPPDERFSSFHEDLDFCWRARLAGFRVLMTPLARARHRGATASGARDSLHGGERARYHAERTGLAALLKNYGFLSLLWVLPAYAVQGVTKLVLWSLSRRFDDVWQVLAAWGWNLLHLPGTIRRRARAQSVRAVPDRSIRRYMAPATIRLRRWSESASGALFPTQRVAEGEPLEEMEELGPPQPFGRRALSFARAHPIASAWVLVAVVAAFAYRHLYGGAQLQGGALAIPPAHAGDYFRELVSSVRTTPLGGSQPASPALGFLGVLSYVFGASTAIADKILLVVLPPAAALGFYRAFVRETEARGPAVVGAACYGLSATLLWAFSQGRIPVLVMLAVLPVLAGRLHIAFSWSGIRPVRFVAATGIVLAAGVAFFPGTALAGALLFLAWFVVPGREERRLPGLGLVMGGAIVAGLLILPQALDLIAGAGHGLASTAGRPSFPLLARLAPGGTTGSWSVAWFLPAAAILSYTMVERSLRSASRYLVAAVVAGLLAWAAAAGYLPRAVSNPAAYLGAAALAYSGLVVYGLASVLPRMGSYAFGYRQLVAVVVCGLLIGGVGLQAIVAARGDWQIGAGRLSPEWSLISAAAKSSEYRVLWLGRLSGDPFAPPGGDPIGTLRVGHTSLRFGVTGRDGVSALDDGRDQRGPGYGYLEQVIGEIVSGDTVQGGALLAPLSVLYVVASGGDLPQTVRRKLDRQLDLDLVQTGDLTIFQNARALPEAAFTPEAQYVKAPLPGISDAGALPTANAVALPPSPGGYRGTTQTPGAVLLGDQFTTAWRASTGAGATVHPQRVFGWAMRFPVSARGPVTLSHPTAAARRAEIALLALFWLVALWITRRPSRA